MRMRRASRRWAYVRCERGQSVVHRLHPVTKLGVLLWVTVVVFWVEAVAVPLVAAGAAVAVLWVARVGPGRIPGLRLWVGLGLAVLVLQVAFVREGETVWGPVTTGGLVAGGRALGRLLAVILMSAAFVATTEPTALAGGLMRVGLPDRWGFALVAALRLAPTFQVQARHVYRAQLVRGVRYDAGGVYRWWLLLRRLCLPLLVSALRTAHWLALSMEGRGFGRYPRRTYRQPVCFGRGDMVVGGLLVMSIAITVWMKLT